jgi:hypothetical protein
MIRYMTDQLNLIAMIMGAFVLYYVYLEYGKGNLNIKNTGTLNLTPSVEETEVPYHPVEETVKQRKPRKRVEHGQIDNIEADEEYMKSVHQDELYKNNTNILPNPQISNEYSPQGNFQPAQQHDFSKLDCFPQDQLVPADL